jgi:hypothetical protein
MGEVNVVITARYSQSAVDLRGCKLAEVPTKTIPAKPDPIDTSTSPGTGGAGASGGSGAGSGAGEDTPGAANSFKVTKSDSTIGWTDAITANQLVAGNPTTGEGIAFLPPPTLPGILAFSVGGAYNSLQWKTVSSLVTTVVGVVKYNFNTGTHYGLVNASEIALDAVKTLSSVQLVDYSGAATKQDPGDSILGGAALGGGSGGSLYGTTLTFDITNSPITIAMSRNATPDSGLVNSDDIELSFGLRDLGITTAKLADGAVNNAKISGVDWSKISGAPPTYAPSAHSHDWAAIVSGKPTTIAGYGITDAITSAYILTGALGGTLGAPTIAANAITSTQIAANAVVAGKIAANAVGGTQIASGAVGASQLATGTISPSHFAAVSGPAVLARATATGSGDPAWLLATTGTQAKFLRSNAAATTMTWDTLIENDLPQLVAYSILANNTASTNYQASISAADGTVLRRVGGSFAFGANVVLGNSTTGTGAQKIWVTATRYVEVSNVTGIITVYIDSNTSVKINTDGTIINRRSGVDYNVCDVATITTSSTPPTGSGKTGQMHYIY